MAAAKPMAKPPLEPMPWLFMNWTEPELQGWDSGARSLKPRPRGPRLQGKMLGSGCSQEKSPKDGACLGLVRQRRDTVEI